MAEVIIYGTALSTYVRTARMTCLEKGVSYDLEELAPQSAEILALSPTGKVPAFRHGDLVLHETSAITRYVDERFDGVRLQPPDVVTRALMNQWISAINDTIYQVAIRQIVLPRLGIVAANDEALEAAAAKLDRQLGLVDEASRGSGHLAGDALSLADLFLAPIVFWLEKTPEGEATLKKHAAASRWYASMAGRESFVATIPSMPDAG